MCVKHPAQGLLQSQSQCLWGGGREAAPSQLGGGQCLTLKLQGPHLVCQGLGYAQVLGVLDHPGCETLSLYAPCPGCVVKSGLTADLSFPGSAHEALSQAAQRGFRLGRLEPRCWKPCRRGRVEGTPVFYRLGVSRWKVFRALTGTQHFPLLSSLPGRDLCPQGGPGVSCSWGWEEPPRQPGGL